MQHETLKARRAGYDRLRWVAGAIGAAPLLSVYFAVHTTYLRTVLPESKLLSLFILFFVPLGWLLGVQRLYRWWGVRRFELRCPDCGQVLTDEDSPRCNGPGTCRGCGRPTGRASTSVANR